MIKSHSSVRSIRLGIISILLISHLQLLYSQIDTLELLSYNPLNIGNRWQYHRVYEPVYNDYITESITGDTVMPNGQRYFIKKDSDKTYNYFLRVDTVVLKIMLYHWWDSSEVALFNFEFTDSGRHCYTDTMTGLTNCSWYLSMQLVGNLGFYADEIGLYVEGNGYDEYHYSRGIGLSYY
ncbi:MAG: hypothetical protein Q7J65_08905, partial [Candidatus Marinimicrobia bacterium]|nr:hypothetical protein [Candidatus Neomarinimicrobiota bacterium]